MINRDHTLEVCEISKVNLRNAMAFMAGLQNAYD